MKNLLVTTYLIIMFSSCNTLVSDLKYKDPDLKILFLHHSTGKNIWYGNIKENMCMVPRLLKEYNDQQGTKISIEERNFPQGNPYPWNNYPYDYYNIWVKNSGDKPHMKEPTLEILTREYDIIVFKHCFPVSNILEDDEKPDINSSKKTIANYTLQYNALKSKLREFPETKFLVWTGAALVESATSPDEAQRARDFNKWVINEWDEPGDNIFIFDFREIETDGGLYLKPEYTTGKSDSHPNEKLSTKAAKIFIDRIITVIEKNSSFSTSN